jgi:hypothetical protein
LLVAYCADFVRTADLDQQLDGPNVGVGLCVNMEERVLPFEVQCCRVRTGVDLLITGSLNPSTNLRECVLAAQGFVLSWAPVLDATVGHLASPRASRPLQLIGQGTASRLHVHLVCAHIEVKHELYTAAMAVSMVSLMLRRRAPEDMGVLGELTADGDLGLPLEAFTEEIVQACVKQGIRRLVLSSRAVIADEAKAALAEIGEDGRPVLELLQFAKLQDALPVIFG